MRRLKPLSPLSRTLAFAAPAVVLTSTSAKADMFLKVDNLEGESSAKTHPKWMEVLSMQFGVNNNGTAITGGGKATATDLVIQKYVDVTSPPLFIGCLQGDVFNEVKLEITALGNQGVSAVYYRLTLNNVRVTSIDTSSINSVEKATEKISLSFSKIKVEYIPINNKGGTAGPPPVTWDFTANTK